MSAPPHLLSGVCPTKTKAIGGLSAPFACLSDFDDRKTVNVRSSERQSTTGSGQAEYGSFLRAAATTRLGFALPAAASSRAVSP